MNLDDFDVNELESSAETWLLGDEQDFESTFGQDLTEAVKEELSDER